MKHISNPDLPIILKNWPGNPVSSSGRFFHPQYRFELTWADIIKWKSRPNPYARAKRKETWRATIIKDDTFLKNKKDGHIWLGHASFFFRINGRNILVDPIFGKLSPIMPRYTELPINPSKFKNIDYILLTHDHRDHCDIPSLKLLLKNNPQAKIICGLNMGRIFSSFIKKENITEMGWYQQYHDGAADIKITYLPTRHWCRRWITDTNRNLWGAFVFQANNKTIYFGGDSGYGDHFKETADIFPNIDQAFLGIGAFAPLFIMQSNHMGPTDAYAAFKDLNAKTFIPMHYGTFDLSDEPLGEPLRLLENIVAENNLNGEVMISEIGEAVY